MGILGLRGKTIPIPTVTETAASREEKWQHPRFSDAPEVVIGTGPEIVPGEAPEALYPTPGGSQLDAKYDDGAIVSPKAPWWTRKKIIIPSVVAFLLVAGLGVGLGVGLTSKSSSNSNSNSSSNSSSDSDTNGTTKTPTSEISCKGGFCQNILSLAVFEDDVFVVARNNKNRITIRPINTTLWEGQDGFVDLGSTPGNLISQPTAFSWILNETQPRIDVFAVSSPDNTVYRRHYSEKEDWAPWEAEGTDIGSAVAACGPFPGKMDVFSRSASRQTIYHDWWFENKMSEGENGWKQLTELGKVGSAPAVVCRPSNFQADLVWYAPSTGAMEHSSWDEDNKEWTASQNFGEGFIGSPAIFSTHDTSWSFFGVQANGSMQHLFYQQFDGGYGRLENLGGNLVSAPAVVSLKDGQMDVLALGSNGNLQHLRFDGQAWATEWEDLGVEAGCAPSAVVHDGRVTIAVVTKDGTLLSLTREADDEAASWKGSLKQEVVGKDLSLEYFGDF